MLISYVFGTVFLYLIFKRLKLPDWLACISALGIMMLSPQIFRLAGHYGLSYTFVLPLTLYLLLIYFDSNKKKTIASLILFLGLACMFIHAYLGLLVISIIFTYSLLHFILSSQAARNLKEHISLTLAALIPVVVFRIYAYLSDTHSYRTENPYGFFEYYADLDTILIPTYGGFREFIVSRLPQFTQSWEGFSYLGLGSILLGVLIFLRWLYKLTTTRSFSFLKAYNQKLLILILAAFILLMFSFGIPFRWAKSLLEYFPILKQFRSIGRFAWPFYYLFNVFTLYFLYNWVKTKNLNKYLRFLLLAIFPALLLYESFDQHQAYADKLSESKNLFLAKNLDQSFNKLLDQINSKEYQAIIPLPYYHIGSENFEVDASNRPYKLSMLASYHLNLPLTSAYLSRPSIKESKLNLQLLGSDYYEKEIQKDVSASKPFLVLQLGNDLKKNENDLVDKSVLIDSSSQMAFYSIQPNKLFQNTSSKIINKFKAQQSSLYQNKGFLSRDSTAFIFYKGLDSSSSKPFIGGNGSVKWIKKGWHLLASVSSDSLAWSQEYLSSFWIYNCGENYGQDRVNYLNLSLREVHNNTIVNEQIIEVNSTYDIKGCWSRIESKPFKKSRGGSIFEFWLGGFEYLENEIIVDEFFIQANDNDVYQKRGNYLFYNNHLIKLDEQYHKRSPTSAN